MKKTEDAYVATNPYLLAVRFYHDLSEEMDYHRRSRTYLTFDQYKILKTYYHKLNSETVEYLAHSNARVLNYTVGCVTNSPTSIRILDAGCGLGSDAIFFSLLGAHVVGVDIRRKRLDIARKRVDYYEKKYGQKLHVRFHLKNILKFYDHDKFDIVWSKQSISHIHPIEDFFKVVWSNLKKGGRLIVSESNNINPYVRFNTWLVHHKSGLYTQAKDPNTLEPIPYAQERIFNPLCLIGLLQKVQFRTKLVQYHGFVPTRFNARKIFRSLNKKLTKIPFIRLMGANYVIVATKNM